MLLSSHMCRFLFAFVLTFVAASQAEAQRAPAVTPPTNSGNPERPTVPVPPEKNSTTSHEMMLSGRTLRYTATAGNLLIAGDDDQPNATVFYVAYTLEGVSDIRSRPLTFLYNGGPGSASMWLHMGSVGPVRVLTSSPEATGPGPYQIAPNQYSLLDQSDLVFVDAVGAGFSRPVGKGTIRDFAGTDQDVRAFHKFIYRYVTTNHRWNSPKFLFGESYGTTRSAALVDALENSGMSFNGVILMSVRYSIGASAALVTLLIVGLGIRHASHAENARESNRGKLRPRTGGIDRRTP